jgi:SecD/SecF fusion protein
LILVAIVALMGGVVALAFSKGAKPNLGLDLQGGLEVVLEAKPPPGRELTESDLDRSVETMRERVDKLGVSEPEIRKQGSDQIVIQLAGVQDPQRAAAIIGKTAQLQFYDLEGDLVSPSVSAEGFPIPSERLYPLLESEEAGSKDGEPSAFYLYRTEDKSLLAGPAQTKAELLDDFGGEVPEDAEIRVTPGNRIALSCGPASQVCPGINGIPARTYYYLFEYQPTDAEDPVPEMTGNDLDLGGTRQDFDPQTGEPIVLMRFTDAGADKFHAITRELATRGRLKTGQLGSDTPILQHFAIVLDGEIRSWPSIDFEQYPDGISGSGGAQISGIGSQAEAEDLALVLQTGALPVRFEQVARTSVSATLGEDSLREALIAAIGGIAAVAVFLLAFYRFLGVVAIIGLAIYGVLLYGAILLFDVTLSLAGFAGLILTIGVAADANVVIFERIKEEVRAGRSVRSAIATGYSRGFSTIVDANVVTMITAFVLFAVASGDPKGFALMLLIGTVISMLTAVVATRALLGTLSGFRWFDNPAFMGASAKAIPRWQQIDFMGKRRLWFAISGVIVAIGVGSLAAQGLNLGIDFRGGSQTSFTTSEPVSVERVRAIVGPVVPGVPVIQGRGEASGDRYTDFQMRSEALSNEEGVRLQGTLREEFGATSIRVDTVSASFSSQILRGAILAICVSLALIFVYVSFRFQWKFAAPVMVALVHDIFITLGIYSLTQREMTESTVAAVLTVLGYSIYDTIIIFDRIRENIPLMRGQPFAQIANQSIWETLRRSLATTFITLLPVTSLFLFGGDTLKDFAFALLVGILSGAYSTVFIASPLLTILKEREPEYAKLKGLVSAPVVKAAPPEPAPSDGRRLLRKTAAVAAPAAAKELALAGEELGEEPTPDGHEADELEETLASEEPVEAEAAAGDGAQPAPEPRKPADAAARREERKRRRRARRHGRAR